MTWDAANTWAAGLDFGPGIDNWRLPTMIDNGNDGCNFAYTGTDCGYDVQTTSGSPPYPATTVYSEMASLFYDTLGNLAYYDTSGTGPQTDWGLSNTGPFDALQSSFYWSGLEYAPNTGLAWDFFFSYGTQDYFSKTISYYALAVHSGDVGAAVVPPATIDDTATVSPDAEIGGGSTIGANTVVEKGVSIGNYSTIGSSVTINKEAQLGDNTEIHEGSTINKNVTAGDGLTVGSNVIIDKNVTIGSNVTIGDNTRIGQSTVIGSNTQIGTIDMGGEGVQIGRNVGIASDQVIGDGSAISSYTTFP